MAASTITTFFDLRMLSRKHISRCTVICYILNKGQNILNYSKYFLIKIGVNIKIKLRLPSFEIRARVVDWEAIASYKSA